MAKHVGIAPSEERTDDFTSLEFKSTDFEGTEALHLVVDVTAATGSIVVSVVGVDLTSRKEYTILQSASLGSAATTVLRVGPAYTASANTIAKDYMPHAWKVKVAHTGGAVTYSIGGSLI